MGELTPFIILKGDMSFVGPRPAMFNQDDLIDLRNKLKINKLKPGLNVEGDILNSKGKFLGKHKGIANYTIGQRKGLGIGGSEFPLYVVKIDKKKNEVVVGHQSLLKKTVICLENINLAIYIHNKSDGKKFHF